MSETVTSAITSATDAAASATASAAATAATPASFKAIGVGLAIASGFFIGSSFVIKKKGLLAAQAKAGTAAGEGHAYLKSWLWWTGMTMMIVGEILNLVAYSFVDAILVTPFGALSVVVCAVLSSFFLGETLTLFGKLGCALAILGSIILALNGPQEQKTTTILAFQKLFIAPGFLVYAGLVILICLFLVFWAAPRYGKTNMLVYITICSLIGGLSVACTSGLGSSILTSIRGDNQFKHWFIYFLLGFVTITLLIEINYLNVALALYNTSLVTPTYYVIFTGATIVTSAILSQGFDAPVVDIVSVVMSFLVICCGITLLQLSKIDPEDVANKLDRKTTILLSATRSQSQHHAEHGEKPVDIEDPGIDTLRGGFGAIGSIHRAMSARKSLRKYSAGQEQRRAAGAPGAMGSGPSEMGMEPMRRGFQLYDNPMPMDAADKISMHSGSSLASPQPQFASAGMGRDRGSSITFAASDNVHLYSPDPTSSAAMHREQGRLGSHTHLDPNSPVPTPLSTDITTTAFSPSSAFGSGGFSPSQKSYLDPYADYDQDADRPDPTRSQTMPRQGSAELADRFSQQFASSTPEFPRAAAAGGPQGAVSPTSGSSRGRFGLPSFSREGSKDGNGHRAPHPHGPADIDAIESERLVGGNNEGRRSSIDSGDGDDSPLERYDPRDQL